MNGCIREIFTTNKAAATVFETLGQKSVRQLLRTAGFPFWFALRQLALQKAATGAQLAISWVDTSRANPDIAALLQLSRHHATVAAQRPDDDPFYRPINWHLFVPNLRCEYERAPICDDIRLVCKRVLQQESLQRWRLSATQGAFWAEAAGRLWKSLIPANVFGLEAFALLATTNSIEWRRGGDEVTQWQNPCSCGAIATVSHILQCAESQHSRAVLLRQFQDAVCDNSSRSARDLCRLSDFSAFINQWFGVEDENELLTCRLMLGLFSRSELQAAFARHSVADEPTQRYWKTLAPRLCMNSGLQALQQCLHEWS